MVRLGIWIALLAISVEVYSAPSWCVLVELALSVDGEPAPQLIELLRFSRQPLSQLEGKSYDELLAIARAAMGATLVLGKMDGNHLPADVMASLEELRERNPSLRYRPELPLSPLVKQGFQKSALQDDLRSLWKNIGARLHHRSRPEERRRIAKELFRRLGEYDAGEMTQAHLDFLANRILGVRSDQVTREVQSTDPATLEALYGKEEVWSEHGETNLLTRYRLVQEIFKHLRLPAGSEVVDIGSGIGNVGTYLGVMHPELKMRGYEFVGARVKEAERVARELGLDGIQYHEQNLALEDFRLPPADVYYAFNPTSGETFDKILKDLRKNARETGRPFRLVVAGPAPLEKIAAQTWLKKVTPEKPFPGDVEVDIFEFDPRRGLP